MAGKVEGSLMPERRGPANFEMLYKSLLARLEDGSYRPGDRIPLKPLSDDLGVSVTPLREALSRLVGRDLVTERRYEGYYLTRLDARDVADLYRLHLVCIARAVTTAPARNVLAGVVDTDIWQMFDALVHALRDRVLVGVRRYLEDRLRLLRRCERALLMDEPAVAGAIRDAIAKSDLASLRERIETFHATRIDQARAIADLLNRGE